MKLRNIILMLFENADFRSCASHDKSAMKLSYFPYKVSLPLKEINETYMHDIKHIVAIDIGSTNIQMAIAKEHAGRLIIVERQTQRINLALGLDDEKKLSSTSIESAITCLREFSCAFSRLPQTDVRIVATHSLRQARNKSQFISAAAKVMPYPIEVIDGKAAAHLIFNGVAHTHQLDSRALIIDIGGGSTELIIGKQFSPSLTSSLPIGSLDIQKRFFNTGQVNHNNYQQASQFINEQLAHITARFEHFGWQQVLGTSDTIHLVCRALEQLFASPLITLNSLVKLRKKLLFWHAVDSVTLHGFTSDEKWQLSSAVCILESIVKQLNITQLTYCNAALKDGVLYELATSLQKSDVRTKTVKSLTNLYHIDTQYSERIIKQLNKFIIQLTTPVTDLEWQSLCAAAKLHEVGLTINSTNSHLHSAYIIEHSDLLGFSAEEHQLITLLIRHQHQHIQQLPSILPIKHERFITLLSLFRLAIICTVGRLNAPPIPLNIHINAHIIEGELSPSLSGFHGLLAKLNEERKQIEETGIELKFRCQTVA